jgi:hypothetical protein
MKFQRLEAAQAGTDESAVAAAGRGSRKG